MRPPNRPALLAALNSCFSVCVGSPSAPASDFESRAAGAPRALARDARVLRVCAKPAKRSFANPIVHCVPHGGSADPSVVFFKGYYYYCRALSSAALGISKSRTLEGIGHAPMKVIWTPPSGTAYSHEVWAPELQRVRGEWYVYFAASDGDNRTHRMYALKALSDDPQGPYAFSGKLSDPTDQWAIDGIVVEHQQALYFVWSGWRDAQGGFPQVLYIAPMSDPLTISGPRVELAAPSFEWERLGAPLLEGPAVLYKHGAIIITYSASASWTDDYALGSLRFTQGDILDPKAWARAPEPILSKLPHLEFFGPGHNCFTTSPDGQEDWILYHAIGASGAGWDARSVRAQRVSWGPLGEMLIAPPDLLGALTLSPSGQHERRRAPRTLATRFDPRPKSRPARPFPANDSTPGPAGES